MSLALAPSPGIRLAGRSFLAFVLEPYPPLATWLADLDAVAQQSFAFFANRPVVLDLNRLAPGRTETEVIVDALKQRHIRVIAVEGVDAAWLDPSMAPIAGGKESAKVVEFPRGGDPVFADSRRSRAETDLIVDRPVRSGQSIFHPEGDVTVLHSISSGAEIIAGGSIHVYGALRGRALAGATGNPNALIFAHRFQAELVSIDGNYLTAEQSPPSAVNRSVLLRLKGEVIVTECLD